MLLLQSSLLLSMVFFCSTVEPNQKVSKVNRRFGKIKCIIHVKPINGFLPIVEERVTIKTIVTCSSPRRGMPTTSKSPLRLQNSRYIPSSSQRNEKFRLISKNLSISAYSEDTTMVTVEPKYPPLTLSRSPKWQETQKSLNIRVFQFRLRRSNVFLWCVYPEALGRTNLIFSVNRFFVLKNTTRIGKLVARRSYRVKVSRNFRAKDMVFRIAMAITTGIATTGLGCGTDIYSILAMFRHEHKVITSSQCIIALLIQAAIRILLIPGLSLGIGMAIGMSHTSIAGMLIWSTTYGGGISYILGSAIGVYEEFMIYLEIVAAILGTVFMPFWIYIGSVVLLDIFDSASEALSRMGWLYLWMITLNAPIALGIYFRIYFPLIAHVYISWILRPTMLLFFILFITLGIYSNLIVVFEVSSLDVLVLGLAITLGMLGSYLVARLLNWPRKIVNGILSQQCSSNLLLGLAICRLGLPHPERDATSKIIFLSFFYSPMPFLMAKTVIVLKNQVNRLYSRQHEQQVSLASGLADVVKAAVEKKHEGIVQRKRSVVSVAEHILNDLNEDNKQQSEDAISNV